MKYIVYREGGRELLVTFPNVINHNHMAEAMDYLRFDEGRGGWHRRQGEVVAAGFVDGGQCHGRSESLGMDSRGSVDTAILKAEGVITIQEGKK